MSSPPSPSLFPPVHSSSSTNSTSCQEWDLTQHLVFHVGNLSLLLGLLLPTTLPLHMIALRLLLMTGESSPAPAAATRHGAARQQTEELLLKKRWRSGVYFSRDRKWQRSRICGRTSSLGGLTWSSGSRDRRTAVVRPCCVCGREQEQEVAVPLTTCALLCDRMRLLHRLGVSVQMQPGRDDLERRLPAGQLPALVLPAVQTPAGEPPPPPWFPSKSRPPGPRGTGAVDRIRPPTGLIAPPLGPRVVLVVILRSSLHRSRSTGSCARCTGGCLSPCGCGRPCSRG